MEESSWQIARAQDRLLRSGDGVNEKQAAHVFMTNGRWRFARNEYIGKRWLGAYVYKLRVRDLSEWTTEHRKPGEVKDG